MVKKLVWKRNCSWFHAALGIWKMVLCEFFQGCMTSGLEKGGLYIYISETRDVLIMDKEFMRE